MKMNIFKVVLLFFINKEIEKEKKKVLW